jgi:methanogenic corrinoid protein MtbC1
MLRRRNVNTIYLGQNVPLDQFVEEMHRLKPAVIVMAATTAETVPGLIEIANAVQEMPAPRPVFAFGGRIFNVQLEMRTRVPGVFLGENARSAVGYIMTLISGSPAAEARSILHIRRDREE